MTQPQFSAQPSGIARPVIRKQLLELRRGTDAALRRKWDHAIGQNVLAWCKLHRPASLGLFWPIQAEPDLREIYPELHKLGLRLALPLVVARAQALQFLEWQPGDTMSADQYGIPVPAQRERTFMPEVLLIPCVGFNAGKFRVGYGGGYYDRTLATQPRPVALGIAYRQAQAEFAAESHDIPMDQILTETETEN